MLKIDSMRNVCNFSWFFARIHRYNRHAKSHIQRIFIQELIRTFTVLGLNGRTYNKNEAIIFKSRPIITRFPNGKLYIHNCHLQAFLSSPSYKSQCVLSNNLACRISGLNEPWLTAKCSLLTPERGWWYGALVTAMTLMLALLFLNGVK